MFLSDQGIEPSVSTALIPESYGLDFNTVKSVLIQLQKWQAEGRETSSVVIKEMLIAAPTYPIPIQGNSVELTIPDVAF